MRVEKLFVGAVLAAALAAVGCHHKLAYNLPPAQQLMHPGPGVGGPGPGVIPPPTGMMGAATPAPYGPGGTPPCEVTPCQYCEGGSCPIGGGGCVAGAGGMVAGGGASQIHFVGQDGLTINWDVSGAGLFDSAALFVPGRQDFQQGAIYRLRLSNIPGREGVTLYPTLEVAPVTPRTDAFLAHAAIPVQFTEEDFDQVMSGNFVTKVIYLPDPEFQELALSGVETLVSTRLDPGVDPVAEADRRGSILAVLRIGSKDLNPVAGGYESGVMPAQYSQGGEGGCPDGSCAPGAGGAGGGMPLGMPTGGMSPGPVPPHLVAGAPQWGMPYTGTPIGLPGPPHIPLGAPAGLQKHVMHNRTRTVLPPPTDVMKVSVKHRPGMNYPRPVNHIHIDEVNRGHVTLPGHGTVNAPLRAAIGAHLQGAHAGAGDPYCDPAYSE
ncbi:hypothetical protein [Botrimarina sp.]|uniref:hypothetical protein n=1 Tax=Botrimarina sp. TaxID=2795802 RepID=UPI0032F03EBE